MSAMCRNLLRVFGLATRSDLGYLRDDFRFLPPRVLLLFFISWLACPFVRSFASSFRPESSFAPRCAFGGASIKFMTRLRVGSDV